MSASLNCNAWKSASGRPNALRSPIWPAAASIEARAAPIEQAAILIRPPSRPAMAIRKPSPSFPTRFTTGTLQSSNTTIAVGCEFQPSFFSCAP